MPNTRAYQYERNCKVTLFARQSIQVVIAEKCKLLVLKMNLLIRQLGDHYLKVVYLKFALTAGFRHR